MQTVLDVFLFLAAVVCCALYIVGPLGMKMFEIIDRKYGAVKPKDESPDATVTYPPGTRGTALSDLRPAGIAELNGRRVDVAARNEFIEEGQEVRVSRVEGNRVYVESVSTIAHPRDHLR